MSEKELATYCPKSRADWRKWLERNHQSKQSIWLVYYKKSSNMPSLSWSEAVDEALCFGWIDSTRRAIDKDRFMQYFSKRKPDSTWSQINKEKVDRLIANKQMTRAGFESIETAKQNGSWNLLDDVENLVMPEDLEAALNKNTAAMKLYQEQSKSIKKGLLAWVVMAKRAETRQKRINEFVKLAGKGKLPGQFG